MLHVWLRIVGDVNRCVDLWRCATHTKHQHGIFQARLARPRRSKKAGPQGLIDCRLEVDVYIVLLRKMTPHAQNVFAEMRFSIQVAYSFTSINPLAEVSEEGELAEVLRLGLWKEGRSSEWCMGCLRKLPGGPGFWWSLQWILVGSYWNSFERHIEGNPRWNIDGWRDLRILKRIPGRGSHFGKLLWWISHWVFPHFAFCILPRDSFSVPSS